MFSHGLTLVEGSHSDLNVQPWSYPCRRVSRWVRLLGWQSRGLADRGCRTRGCQAPGKRHTPSPRQPPQCSSRRPSGTFQTRTGCRCPHRTWGNTAPSGYLRDKSNKGGFRGQLAVFERQTAPYLCQFVHFLCRLRTLQNIDMRYLYFDKKQTTTKEKTIGKQLHAAHTWNDATPLTDSSHTTQQMLHMLHITHHRRMITAYYYACSTSQFNHRDLVVSLVFCQQLSDLPIQHNQIQSK